MKRETSLVEKFYEKVQYRNIASATKVAKWQHLRKQLFVGIQQNS